MRQKLIIVLSLLILFSISCSHKATQVEFKDSLNEKADSFDQQSFERAIDLSKQAKKNSNLKLAIIYLKEAVRMSPKDKKLNDELAKLKVRLNDAQKKRWQEAAIDEQYNRIHCAGQSESCAIERWRSIVSGDFEEGDYYRKSLNKLIQYELID